MKPRWAHLGDERSAADSLSQLANRGVRVTRKCNSILNSLVSKKWSSLWSYRLLPSIFFADEVLKASHFYDDPQAKMTNAEVITAVLTAAHFFHGNQRTAARFLKLHRYTQTDSKVGSGLRRLHLKFFIKSSCRVHEHVYFSLMKNLRSLLVQTQLLNQFVYTFLTFSAKATLIADGTVFLFVFGKSFLQHWQSILRVCIPPMNTS
jgi:hypothetical protein